MVTGVSIVIPSIDKEKIMGKTSKQCYNQWLSWWYEDRLGRGLTYSQWGRALKADKFREKHSKNDWGWEYQQYPRCWRYRRR